MLKSGNILSSQYGDMAQTIITHEWVNVGQGHGSRAKQTTSSESLTMNTYIKQLESRS